MATVAVRLGVAPDEVNPSGPDQKKLILLLVEDALKLIVAPSQIALLTVLALLEAVTLAGNATTFTRTVAEFVQLFVPVTVTV